MADSVAGSGRRPVVVDDRGDAGGHALMWLLAMVSLLGLMWVGIQVGFTHYGQSMARAAAQAGVRAAVTTPGDASRAAPAAAAFISEHAAKDVFDPQVTVTVDGASVTVTVTGRGVTVVPGTSWTVTGGASGPLERAP